MKKSFLRFFTLSLFLFGMMENGDLFAQGKTGASGSLDKEVRRKIDYFLAFPIAEIKEFNLKSKLVKTTAEIASEKERLKNRLTNFANYISIKDLNSDEPTVEVLIKTGNWAALQANRKIKITGIHEGLNVKYLTAVVKIADLEEIASNSNITFIEAAKIMYPELDTSTDLINAKDVWDISGLNNINKKITGKNVYVGVIDGLVQWEHETFVDERYPFGETHLFFGG